MASSNTDNRKTVDEFAPPKGQTREQAAEAGRRAIRAAAAPQHRQGAAKAIGLPVGITLLVVLAFVFIAVASHKHTTQVLQTRVALRTTQQPWSRPENQLLQIKAAGLTVTPQETLAVHYHSHLDVIVEGKHYAVPAGLGINEGPKGQKPPMGSAGLAALHTHDTTGVLHIEAPKRETFTLGQVFTEWGVALGKGKVGGYRDGHGWTVSFSIDGRPYVGDPKQIALTSHEEIAVVVTKAGATAVTAPATYAFAKGL